MKRIAALLATVGMIGTTAWLWACGPWLTELQPVMSRGPADESACDKGELGVVRPEFSLDYLVQAYRTMVPASRDEAMITSEASARRPPDSPDDFVSSWARIAEPVVGSSKVPDYQRQAHHLPDAPYQTFTNCPNDAFATALRTLEERRRRLGAESAQVRDWIRAQEAVFDNCPGGPLVLPTDPGEDADPLVRADRAYQTAAAYFYAMEYDEAIQRFKAIAVDATSPWRPYGGYLAARANIRYATVLETDGRFDGARLSSAETDLRQTLADPTASALHVSARGLLSFIAARIHPVDRLHELSRRLTASKVVDDGDFYDYRFILDNITNTSDSVAARADLVRGDDLTDWLLTMRGVADPPATHAVERWRENGAPHWLVAALWRKRAPAPDADALLDAAGRLDRHSPEFATAAFLRVRLLAQLGRRQEARSVLASLPVRPGPGFTVETINLLRAERLMLAQTFDQFLANAPRAIVARWKGFTRLANGRLKVRAQGHDQMTFDADAAMTLNRQLPLTRLIEASRSTQLPRRLRLRVAIAAFTRAIVLDRDESARTLVPVLRELAPVLGSDLDQYTAASTVDGRHDAGLMLLLRTPGASTDIRWLDDDYSINVVEPARDLDHMFRRNWWCAGASPDRSYNQWYVASSETRRLLYGDGDVPVPSFVTPAERDAVNRELKAVAAAGQGVDYLGRAAIRIVQAHPADPVGADTLSRVVDGVRWSACRSSDGADPLPKRAFVMLHRLFPRSEGAQRTKYWYRD